MLFAFLSGGLSLQLFLAYAISIIGAITFHEFAHAKVATMCGDPTPERDRRLSLNPLDHLDPIGTIMILLVGFGWGKPVMINPYYFRKVRRDLMLVALAGPATNIVLCGVGVGALHIIGVVAGLGSGQPLTEAVRTLGMLFRTFALLNLMLAAFNLIPLGGLDGVKIVQWFLPEAAAERFYRFSTTYGWLLFMLLIMNPRALAVVFLPFQVALRYVLPGWVWSL
jgi:Zn-dependent protease